MNPVERELYFAFGSNMDPEQMARRLRDPWPIGPAVLLEYRRTFPLYSQRWGGGVASAARSAGHRLHGVLYELTAEDLEQLDGWENVRTDGWGHYKRERVTVQTTAGRGVEAWTYIARPGRSHKPPREYVETMLRGATHFRLPASALNELRAML